MPRYSRGFDTDAAAAHLGRRDRRLGIWMKRLGPIDDLGVRRGAQRVDGLDALPTPKALAETGERWGPYRTYASLTLWRIADAAADAKSATRRSQG